MAPLRADLTFRVGDTFTGPIWAVVVNGTAVDLTAGWTVRAQARPRAGSSTVLMEWSTDLGRVVLGTATVTRGDGSTVTTSTVRLVHTAADGAALLAFTGRYDCEITKGIENYTITEGAVVAAGDVTR